jgi:hypothetical protein
LSNWGTAKRIVQERIHRYGSADPVIISRALAEAIGRYNTTRFWFNTTSADVPTVAGTYEYGQETSDGALDGYPTDMLKPVKLTMRVSSTWYDITTISIDEFRDKFLESSYRGFPEKWCWFAKNIMLYPTPNGVYAVKIDYIQDIGTPVASWDGSVWSYSVAGVAIDDTYTNNWFTEGMDLITARAVYFIASQHLGKPQLAQLAKGLEQEQLDELLINSESVDLSPYPRPWQ